MYYNVQLKLLNVCRLVGMEFQVQLSPKNIIFLKIREKEPGPVNPTLVRKCPVSKHQDLTIQKY